MIFRHQMDLFPSPDSAEASPAPGPAVEQLEHSDDSSRDHAEPEGFWWSLAGAAAAAIVTSIIGIVMDRMLRASTTPKASEAPRGS